MSKTNRSENTLNIVRVMRGKTAGQWRWNVTARNGKIVCDSAESYKRVGAMLTMLRHLFAGSVLAEQIEAWEAEQRRDLE